MAELAIKIDVQTTEVEFDFAGVIIQADASDENISEMLDLKGSDLQKKADKKMEEIKAKDMENISKEDFKMMVDTTIELYGGIYSTVFGKGAFEKVYDNVKSISATVNAFDQAFDYIVEQREEQEQRHMKKKQQKINKYKNRMK